MMSSNTRRHLYVAIQMYWPVLKEGRYYFDINEGRLVEMATQSDEKYLETVMSGASQSFGIRKADGEEFNIVVHIDEAP